MSLHCELGPEYTSDDGAWPPSRLPRLHRLPTPRQAVYVYTSLPTPRQAGTPGPVGKIPARSRRVFLVARPAKSNNFNPPCNNLVLNSVLKVRLNDVVECFFYYEYYHVHEYKTFLCCIVLFYTVFIYFIILFEESGMYYNEATPVCPSIPFNRRTRTCRFAHYEFPKTAKPNGLEKCIRVCLDSNHDPHMEDAILSTANSVCEM